MAKKTTKKAASKNPAPKNASKPAAKPASKPAPKPAAKKPLAKSPAKSAPAASKPAPRPGASLAPYPVSTGPGPGPAEIGAAVVSAFNAGVHEGKLWDAHWHNDVESIEGVGVNLGWSGRKAMQAKGDEWMKTHTIHGASAEGPYIGATGFSIKFRMDVTDTAAGKRTMMEEVGVYTVKNGKIIREEFMYGTSTPV